MSKINFNTRPQYTTIFIATHKTTNLKYLAKTTQYHTHLELEEKYHGSGKRWTNHLNKHGKDVRIEIIGTFKTSEVRKYAVAVSYANNVVISNDWANLMIEDGLSGGNAFVGKTENEMNEIKQKMSDSHKGIPRSEEAKRNISNGQKGDKSFWYGKKQSAELIKKRADAVRGSKRTDLSKQNSRNAWLSKELVQCPYCDTKSKSVGSMNRWHFDNCKHKPK